MPTSLICNLVAVFGFRAFGDILSVREANPIILADAGNHLNGIAAVDNFSGLNHLFFQRAGLGFFHHIVRQGCEFEQPKTCDLYIAPMEERAIPLTMKLGQMLRISGYQVEYDLMSRGIKAQMKYANKIGASFVLVLGETELENGTANLKNMQTGEQTEIALDDTFEEKFDDIAIQGMFHDIVNDFEKECKQ